MIGILTLVAIGMAYVTVVVSRIVSKQDKLLPSIFGFMTASVTMYIVLYVQAEILEYRMDWFLNSEKSLKCTTTYLSYTASLLFIIGVILNLAKWL